MVVEGNVLSKFNKISLSSIDENYIGKEQFFEIFLRILKAKQTSQLPTNPEPLGERPENHPLTDPQSENTDIPEDTYSKYIVRSQRNGYLAS